VLDKQTQVSHAILFRGIVVGAGAETFQLWKEMEQ
jgi:hypothetical protein